MPQFKAPTGARIIGTHEKVEATAICASFSATGEPVYSGGSDIHWDSQITQTNDKGQTLYTCEEWCLWTFDQLTMIEGTEDDTA